MAQLLRQSTAVQVHIGPALTTGGVAIQTALTATGTAKRAFKHLATAAVTVTGAPTHIAVGHYRLNLTTTYTNTLGLLTLAITATAGTNKSLPMWKNYMVVPANVYDSLVSGGDRLDVNATQWAGVATATGDIAVQNSLTDKAGFSLVTGQHDAIGTRVWVTTARTLTSGLTVANSVWAGTTRTLTSGGVFIPAIWSYATRTLTAGGGSLTASGVWTYTARVLTSGGAVWTAGARTLTSGGTVADSVWVETARTLTSAGVVWTAGTRALTDKAGFTLTTGQHDTIGTRVWVTTTRTLTSAAVAWTAGARTLTSAGVVWTAAARGLTSKVGFALTTGQHDSIGTRAWAVTARTLTSGGNVASSVWGRSIADVTGSPPGTAVAAGTRLAYIYVGTRYKRTTTATGDTLHNSASAVIAKAPISASTTVFTRGKFVSVTG